jgi:DNA-damage-inducible protein J
MAQSTLSVRMDEDVKKNFELFCADVGMNASVAVNMFARAVLREQKLPFEVVSYNVDPFYSAENQKRLANSKRRMEETGGAVHELIEAEND